MMPWMSVQTTTERAAGVLQLNDVEVKFRRTAGNMPVPAAPVAMAMPADSVAADEAAVPADTLTDAASMDTDTEDATLTLVPVTSVKVGTFRRCRCGLRPAEGRQQLIALLFASADMHATHPSLR